MNVFILGLKVTDTAQHSDGKCNVIAEALPSSERRVSTRVQLIQKVDHYVGKLLDQLEARILRAGVAERVQKAFVKIKFNDLSTTTVEKMGTRLFEDDYRLLLLEGLERKSLPVRLMGLGVRLTPEKKDQLSLDMDA